MNYLTVDDLGLDEFYGVMACGIGEDGEILAAFTHDTRRAIAAARALCRMNGDVLEAVKSSDSVWWRVVDNCGCGETCPHEPDKDGDVECDNCEHFGLPPCDELYAFRFLVCKPGDSGALPVTTMEVEVR